MQHLSNVLLRIVVMLPILLFSLVIHEVAHGYAAYLMGDPTAKRFGRLTLDPLAHLDPLGTLMMVWTLVTGYGIGWAKPVPVDFETSAIFASVPLRLGYGPLANILLALLFSVPFAMLCSYAQGGGSPYLAGVLAGAIVVNLSLAAFNLLPIPPLDGSRVVLGLLRGRLAFYYAQLEKYGMFILLMLVLLGWLWRLVFPIVSFLGPLIMRWTGVPFQWVWITCGALL